MKIRKSDSKSDKKRQTDIGKQSSRHRNKIIALGIIAAVIGGIAVISYKLDNTASSEFPSIDSIQCDQMEYATFHIHAHLDIFINGNPVVVPALIGIEDSKCLYWLHTHKTDGIIHIEAPQTRDFILGQFFDVWKSTGPGVIPSGDPIIYINGQSVSTSLKDTPLNAHDEIVLVYGNPPTNIPTFYQFPEGL
ncbi:MAG: hypothetical protein ACREA3_06380 [Nitrosotalea sp.]